MQLIRLGGVKKLRQRCERCADGEAPPDLPSVEAMKPTFTPMVPMRAVADSLPLDWKAAQSGEREPGSDDE